VREAPRRRRESASAPPRPVWTTTRAFLRFLRA